MKRMRKDRHYAFYLTPPTFRITIDCGIERVGKVAEQSICKKFGVGLLSETDSVLFLVIYLMTIFSFY